MNNVIVDVAPKFKTMVHVIILNSSISCWVVIYMFGFKTYWKQVVDMMNIQTNQTFKQFLKSETLNAVKTKSYYQQ